MLKQLPTTEGKPVGIKKGEIDTRSFLQLSFAHKDLHVINILHHKSVKSDDATSRGCHFMLKQSPTTEGDKMI
jgi:hypothetical protein